MIIDPTVKCKLAIIMRPNGSVEVDGGGDMSLTDLLGMLELAKIMYADQAKQQVAGQAIQTAMGLTSGK